MLAAGNDYLPGVRGLVSAPSGLDRMWACYLALRATKRFGSRSGSSLLESVRLHMQTSCHIPL